MAAAAPSLKGRALRWLAQREHSRAELARKLLRHVQAAERQRAAAPDEAEPEDPAALKARIGTTLDDLAASGLLSDTRTAESVVRAKSARFGQRRLRQELAARGVPPEEAQAALAGTRESEFERAQALWRRRFGSRASDAREAARQARFMAARGFDADIIRRLLRLSDEDSPAL